MNLTKPLLLILAPMLLGAAGVQAPAAQPWEPLFNGRDLTGWTPKIVGHPAGDNFAGTFGVSDGAIRVSYTGYDGLKGRFGHLFHHRPLRYFKLRLKYRLVGKALPDTPSWAFANSGVMIHSQAPGTMGIDQRFPVSVEVQLLARIGPAERSTANMCSPGTTIYLAGKREETHCVSSSSPTLPIGRWTTLELDVLPNGEIVHRIDGREVMRYDRAELDPKDPEAAPIIAARGGHTSLSEGYLALQSEGHPVEFKDIEVQRLEPITG